MDWATNDVILQTAALLAAIAWAVLRASGWFQTRKETKLAQALSCIMDGVHITYTTYVQDIKRGREDGTLTDDECKRARTLALESALKFAQDEGIDLLRILGGADRIQACITDAVNQAKNG